MSVVIHESGKALNLWNQFGCHIFLFELNLKSESITFYCILFWVAYFLFLIYDREGWNKTERKIAKMINLQVIRIIICSFSYLIFSIPPSALLSLPLSPFHASCLELGFSPFWPALSSRCLLQCSDHWCKEQGLAVWISLVRQIVHVESHLWFKHSWKPVLC